MRKKFVGVVLVVLVSAFLLLKSGTTFNSSEADRLYQETLAKIEARNRLDSTENGFPLLKPLWEGKTYQDPSSVPLADYWQGPYDETLASIEANPEDFARDLKRFREETVPLLVSCLERSTVAFPIELGFPDLETEIEGPESIPRDGKMETRSLILALVTAATHSFAEGQQQQGVDYLVLGYRFLAHQAPEAEVVTVLLRIANVGILTAATLEFLTRIEFTPRDLERLASALAEEVLPPDGYGRAMDVEYCLFRYRVDAPVPGQGGGGLGQVLGGLYMSRNLKVMTEFYLRHRSDYYDLRRTLTPEEIDEELNGRWLADLVRINVISIFKSRDQYRLALTELEATRAVTAILLYEREHKALPPGVEALARAPIDFIGQLSYRLRDGDFILESSSDLYSAMNRRNPIVFHPYTAHFRADDAYP